MKGAIWSLLGLTLLQAALSGRTNTGRIGELATSVSNVLSYVIDPKKPAIPNLSSSSTSTSSGTGSGSSGSSGAQKGTGGGRLSAPTPTPTVSPNSSSSYVA